MLISTGVTKRSPKGVPVTLPEGLSVWYYGRKIVKIRPYTGGLVITPRQGVAITPRQGVAITPSSRKILCVNDFYKTKGSSPYWWECTVFNPYCL